MRPAARAHYDQVNAVLCGFARNCLSGVVTIDDQASPIQASQVSRT